MLHGKKTERGRKRDTLTIKFLKKYIHYAKHRIQPDLTDEVMMLYSFIYSTNCNVATPRLLLTIFVHRHLNILQQHMQSLEMPVQIQRLVHCNLLTNILDN